MFSFVPAVSSTHTLSLGATAVDDFRGDECGDDHGNDDAGEPYALVDCHSFIFSPNIKGCAITV